MSEQCEHGLSAELCMGPMHYPTSQQEREMGLDRQDDEVSERFAGEALDGEYETYCDVMQGAEGDEFESFDEWREGVRQRSLDRARREEEEWAERQMEYLRHDYPEPPF